MNNPNSNSEPLVSVITLNYKNESITLDFLKSIHKITYPKIEVIVVDNSSAFYPEKLTSNYPKIKLIISKENLGFAGGNNLGLNIANGELILFINNDTEVEKDFLEPLVKRIQSDNNIALVSPKICFFHDKNVIQYAGFSDLKHFILRNKTIGLGQIDNGDFDQPTSTYFPHGAAMLTSREKINVCGPMDDRFFLYYEEMDWGLRFRKAGYLIFYEPASKIYHKESLSTGQNSPLKTYFLNRNRMFYLRKHFKGFQLNAGIIFLLFVVFPKNLLIFLLKIQFKHAHSLIRAVNWNLINRKQKFN
ncbi:MAG: glycosyltransferase family 2 protein [Bacteroidetes bacterium]|jgi:GT2 family glycosyltransferase|nr:glycosyltransferase family 2 protein [Bacteroidota bacterium]MBT7996599.1 glycosyltransferase family 2 protein [Bacteroidota bacterium]